LSADCTRICEYSAQNSVWAWREHKCTTSALVSLKPKPGENIHKFTWCLRKQFYTMEPLLFCYFPHLIYKYLGSFTLIFLKNLFYVPFVVLQLWIKTRNSKRKAGVLGSHLYCQAIFSFTNFSYEHLGRFHIYFFHVP